MEHVHALSVTIKWAYMPESNDTRLQNSVISKYVWENAY